MEDQTNGYIYEIASPVELGVAGYRGQALIVWRHGDDAETAQLVRGAGGSCRNAERGPVERRTAATPD